MILERIWTANLWRNYNYLIACPETGEALAVDPLDHAKCLATASARGWQITQVLNTHEHWDHTGGNDELIAATGARLLAHSLARPNIPNMDRGLGAGDVIRVGRTVELECLDTPGHTSAHICLLAHGERPALISGDTLFNAGAGNCHNGGHPERLFETFSNLLARLPEETQIYPGHDYIARNLAFTLDLEPGNACARELLAQVEHHDPASAIVTTLAQEKGINTFFRLQHPALIEALRTRCAGFPSKPDARTVFLALRSLRNKW